jgi:hypothetical protein
VDRPQRRNPDHEVRTVSPLFNVEPMTGIEPAYSAWEIALAQSALFAR